MPDTRPAGIPPRRRWPEPTPHTNAGALLTDIMVITLRLNGHVMDIAQHLAAEGGMTAAWWQVLGGVLDQPRTVADIGRRMGMTRQAVQRIADLLAEQGLAEYRPNPNHVRAKLLACTEAGDWAIRRIALVQHPWANRVGSIIGDEELHNTVTAMRHLLAVLEAHEGISGISAT